jgi:hypothetical protein
VRLSPICSDTAISGCLVRKAPISRGQDVLAGNAGAAHDQLAADPPLELIDRLLRLAGQRQQAPSVAEQQLTGRGGGRPPTQTVEQLHTQLVFQRANVLGHGRLGEKQGFGRTGETAELGDSNEDLEPAKIHQTRKARRALRGVRRSRPASRDQ